MCGWRAEITLVTPHRPPHLDCLNYCRSQKSFVGLRLALTSILHPNLMGPPSPVSQSVGLLTADLRVLLQALVSSPLLVLGSGVVSDFLKWPYVPYIWQKFLIYFDQLMIPFLRYFLILKMAFCSVYMSMPLSHFVPAYSSPSPCPQVHTLHLCLYSCPAPKSFRTFFFRFHKCVLAYSICFSLSDLLHSV